jgi:2-dehydro-3-deoxyphosphogluconate aldolase / (4S)-4-hydroxy-2-oxoglutarate aldolase
MRPDVTPNSHLKSAAIRALLAQNRVVPVIVIERIEDAVPLARALVAGGIRALEITLRTPAALEAARRIKDEVEGALVGLGTVTRAADLDAADALGAAFAVSPGATANLLKAAATRRTPLLPGVATASDLMQALEHGVDAVKFFPAVPAGGIAAVKALAGPFPDVRFCPTGGIGPDTAAQWLAVPVVSAIGGSWLAPADVVKAGRWADITALAAAARKLWV